MICRVVFHLARIVIEHAVQQQEGCLHVIENLSFSSSHGYRIVVSITLLPVEK